MSLVRTLHHFPLDPASRQVRLSLAEKRLTFVEEIVRYWEQPKAFLALNPSGVTPVLVEQPAERRGRGDLRDPRHPGAPGDRGARPTICWARKTRPSAPRPGA